MIFLFLQFTGVLSYPCLSNDIYTLYTFVQLCIQLVIEASYVLKMIICYMYSVRALLWYHALPK